MNWLKANYEKALLGATLVALLVCGVLIYLSVKDFPSTFAERQNTKRPDNTIKPLPVEVVTSAAETVKKPHQWNSHEGSLLVSRPYVLREKDLIDPLAGKDNLHDPITNTWLIDNDLNYWETDIKDQDPDEDGFSNLDEFIGGTNPKDRNSMPPYYTKLRLKKFISKPFLLRFTGTPDDGQTFTINTKDQKSRTQFLEMNAMIAGTPYKLIKYEKKQEVRSEIEVDTSELTIENTVTGQKIVLVANKEANDPTSFGEFLYLIDNSVFTVKKEEDFTLKPETERKYKLIDISDKEAQIKDLQSGEQHNIPPIQ